MGKKLTSNKAKQILHDKEIKEHPLTDKQRRFFGAIAGGAKPYKAESGGWLDKYVPKAQNGIEGTMGGLTDIGFDYNGAWGGPSMQMGGSIPGAVGFTYTRTNSPAPSNGKYAKKTMASAQDGKVIKDDLGQWAHPGEITEINSNDITMEGVPYDVLGISDTGDVKLMKPGKNYKFKGKKVTEYPMAKNGVNQQDEKTLQQLDQLTNFTNYNTKQPGGWLDTL